MVYLLQFLGSAVAKMFTDKVISYVAYKALLVLLFTVIVPIVLTNFAYDILEIFYDVVNSQTEGLDSNNLLSNGTMNFTGFAAWIMQAFKIPEVFSILVSALMLRTSLKMIPFLRF